MAGEAATAESGSPSKAGPSAPGCCGLLAKCDSVAALNWRVGGFSTTPPAEASLASDATLSAPTTPSPQRGRHFAFGENWRSFVRIIDAERIENAQRGLLRLFVPEDLCGRTFLDIGCGSGLSSLAASRLGVASVTAIDVDQNSVFAAQALLGAKVLKTPWTATTVSVFDLPPDQYDIVYSWGVLHHTGDMWRAIRVASARVKPAGLIAIAIYAKTPFCCLWRIEKALYSRAPKWVQFLARRTYLLLWALAVAVATRRCPFRPESRPRGMDLAHDIHDWLGGYPYESATPDEVRGFLVNLGFSPIRESLVRERRGVLGSGCDEYVFTRDVPG
jgi:2-polyprenyl-6-hydroxyphenyl methylase/3-demethylubiquinone-9 3-methyltransferase